MPQSYYSFHRGQQSTIHWACGVSVSKQKCWRDWSWFLVPVPGGGSPADQLVFLQNDTGRLDGASFERAKEEAAILAVHQKITALGASASAFVARRRAALFLHEVDKLTVRDDETRRPKAVEQPRLAEFLHAESYFRRPQRPTTYIHTSNSTAEIICRQRTLHRLPTRADT